MSRKTRRTDPVRETEAALEKIGLTVDRMADRLKARSGDATRCFVPGAGTLLVVASLAAAGGVAVWLMLSHRKAANTDAGICQASGATRAQPLEGNSDVVRAVSKGLAAGLRKLARKRAASAKTGSGN